MLRALLTLSAKGAALQFALHKSIQIIDIVKDNLIFMRVFFIPVWRGVLWYLYLHMNMGSAMIFRWFLAITKPPMYVFGSLCTTFDHIDVIKLLQHVHVVQIYWRFSLRILHEIIVLKVAIALIRFGSSLFYHMHEARKRHDRSLCLFHTASWRGNGRGLWLRASGNADLSFRWQSTALAGTSILNTYLSTRKALSYGVIQ